MAFLKRCVSTVAKCDCGNPGVINIRGIWYCLDCKDKKEKPQTPNN